MLELPEPEGFEASKEGILARAGRLLRRPFASLPSRIITSVFAAALFTSLAVTWISTQSTESFLRDKIDEKFPAILRSASERLDLWYSQREIDIQTFASSATAVENVGRLARGSGAAQRARGRRELEREAFRPSRWAAKILRPRHRGSALDPPHLQSPTPPGRRVPSLDLRARGRRPGRARPHHVLSPEPSAFRAGASSTSASTTPASSLRRS